jgi:pseudouridine-5'-phosphate glycosidase
MKHDLKIQPEVDAALTAREPVVALESTVIAHGLPYPDNAKVAARLESIVRAEGAVPATIGVVDGVPSIGLDAELLDRFASADDVLKASVRDLGPVMARGVSAATTVAATAVLANRAGIDVFATGGIGGVHRGGEASLDISADMTTLSTTPIAVVCAGAKAILDLPRTLELLETLGIPVLGLGTGEFPAFYSRSSGLSIEHPVADEPAAARAIEAHRALGLSTGILVCVPPPADQELAAAEVGGWIDTAESEAIAAGVTGKALTPWLLARLAELSEGRTVATNVALLENNARAAARIAVALRKGDSPRVEGF